MGVPALYTPSPGRSSVQFKGCDWLDKNRVLISPMVGAYVIGSIVLAVHDSAGGSEHTFYSRCARCRWQRARLPFTTCITTRLPSPPLDGLTPPSPSLARRNPSLRCRSVHWHFGCRVGRLIEVRVPGLVLLRLFFWGQEQAHVH